MLKSKDVKKKYFSFLKLSSNLKDQERFSLSCFKACLKTLTS